MASLDEAQQLLSDEAEALESIYGDEIRAISLPDREYIIALNSRGGGACHIHILLGADYPQKPPAEIRVEAFGLSNGTREAMRGAMLLAMEPGEPGVYAAVEAAREVLDIGRIALCHLDHRPNPEASHEENCEPDQEVASGVAANENTDAGGFAFVFDPPNQKYGQRVKWLDAASAAAENAVEIVSGETVTEKKSIFQAHLALGITSRHQLDWAMRALLEVPKVARATHNISAYRFVDDSKGALVQVADNDDDGEDGAGTKLAQLLDVMKAQGVLVVVSRWYGGVHLGPGRFRLINNAARSLLTAHGFGCVADATDKGSKGGKKK
jgi:hypothetical protein